MKMKSKPSSSRGQKPAKSGKFKDRDLWNTDPNKEQFEPTDAQPIRQHARMAGDPIGIELHKILNPGYEKMDLNKTVSKPAGPNPVTDRGAYIEAALK